MRHRKPGRSRRVMGDVTQKAVVPDGRIVQRRSLLCEHERWPGPEVKLMVSRRVASRNYRRVDLALNGVCNDGQAFRRTNDAVGPHI